jgi:hypothetical protein
MLMMLRRHRLERGICNIEQKDTLIVITAACACVQTATTCQVDDTRRATPLSRGNVERQRGKPTRVADRWWWLCRRYLDCEASIPTSTVRPP